jgi:amidase
MAQPTPMSYTSAASGGIHGVKIGVVQDSLAPSGSSSKTLASLEAGLAKLEAAGGRVTPVHIPLWLDAWPIENGVLTFGLAAMFASGGQGYGHLGRVDTELLAVTAAQNRLQSRDLPLMLELRRQITQALADVDVLVTPTTPTGPFRLLEEPTTDEALLAGMRLDATFNTSPLDLSGHPALTVPCGTCEEDMPVGMQIIGRHFDEMMVYRVDPQDGHPSGPGLGATSPGPPASASK